VLEVSLNFFLRLLFSFPSALANSSEPRCLRSRVIWILIVFLQPPVNAAVGERNRTITRQSHPICRGYEGEFVCFNSDRSNLYCWPVPMKSPLEKKKKEKKKKPLCVQDYGVEAH